MKDNILINISPDKFTVSIMFQENASIYNPINYDLEENEEEQAQEQDKKEKSKKEKKNKKNTDDEILKVITSEKLTQDEILDFLHANNILFGIDNQAISNALQEYIYNRYYTVANGIPPTKGDNAYIQYFASSDTGFRPEDLGNGKVNFKELNFVSNTRNGDIVAKKIVATQGAHGTNVFGETLPGLMGADLEPRIGNNVMLLVDNLTIVATNDGQFKITNGVLSVDPLIVINSDIGPATGNVTFLGSIVVNGNVLEGYKVKAKGDIEIKGMVEGGSVECSGNIVVTYGVQGRDKGILRAQQNIMVKFIENCVVEASGDIISEAILHSSVKCKSNIIVQTGKGKIVGGNIVALKGIDALEVGSPMGTKTKIRIGVEPELVELYQELHKTYMAHLADLEKTNKNISYLEKQPSALTGKKQILLNQAKLVSINLTNEINLCKFRLKSLENTMNEGRRGVIKSKNWFYEGTEIYIGNRTKTFTTDIIGGKCFIYDGNITLTHV